MPGALLDREDDRRPDGCGAMPCRPGPAGTQVGALGQAAVWGAVVLAGLAMHGPALAADAPAEHAQSSARRAIAAQAPAVRRIALEAVVDGRHARLVVDEGVPRTLAEGQSAGSVTLLKVIAPATAIVRVTGGPHGTLGRELVLRAGEAATRLR